MKNTSSNSSTTALVQTLTGLKAKTQNLYFQFKVHANRKGICHCVNEIIRSTGAQEQDVRELLEQHLIDVTKQEDTIILLEVV